MRWWRVWKLQTKLVVCFSFLFACSIVSSGIFYYYSSVSEVKKQTLQLLDSNSRQKSRSLELYIEDMDKLSLSVFNDSLVQRALSEGSNVDEVEKASLNQQVTSHLLNLSVSWPSVQGIFLYPSDNEQTMYFWSKRSPNMGYSITQEPWYPTIKTYTQSPFLLWPTMTENSITNFMGEKVFSLIRPINQIPTGKRIGYMKMDIEVQVMKDLIAYKDDGESQDSSLLILNDQGHVIYDNQGNWTGKIVTDFSPAILNDKSSSGSLIWQDRVYLYSANQSTTTHWITLILKPIDSITAKLKEIRNTVMGIEFAVLLLVIVIAWLIATGVTRPLRTMIVTMRHVERGDFTVRFSQADSRNEVAQLGKVFNQMLNSLEDMISKVYVAELREKDARLLALQAQINPHFLFNTLNILKSLGRKGANQEVVEVTESLAQLFRYSLYNWERSVELREELQIVQSYIKIQKYRFGNRFSYEEEIPEDLLGARILRLMIQPLVENAVVHGLEKKRSDGLVKVRVQVKNGILEIYVSDNGIGLDDNVQDQLKRNMVEIDVKSELGHSEHLGIALVNIQKRLHLLFGQEYGLTFTNNPSGGTIVLLTLPLLFH